MCRWGDDGLVLAVGTCGGPAAANWEAIYAAGAARMGAFEVRELLKVLERPDVLSFAGGIAERHFARMPFAVGGRPTVADLSMCAYLSYPVEETGFDLTATNPAIAAWLARIAALPGWRAL